MRASVVAFVLLFAGCGDNSDSDSVADSTQDVEPAGPPLDEDDWPEEDWPEGSPSRDELLAAYEASTDARQAAFDPPDPDHPELLATHDRDLLTDTQARIEDFANRGVSLDSTVETSPTIVQVGEHNAVVRDCFREEGQQVDTETGEPAGERFTETWHMDTHLLRVDGTWKAFRQNTVEESCTPGG